MLLQHTLILDFIQQKRIPTVFEQPTNSILYVLINEFCLMEKKHSTSRSKSIIIVHILQSMMIRLIIL